jgi:hypothetical protein
MQDLSISVRGQWARKLSEGRRHDNSVATHPGVILRDF